MNLMSRCYHQPPDPLQNPKDYVAFCMASFLQEEDPPDRVWSWIGRAEANGRLSPLVEACQKQWRAGWTVDDLDDVPPGKGLSRVISYLTAVMNDPAHQVQRTTHPSFQIANSLGDPIIDHQERRRRIIDDGWPTDPDPGQPWSIPDEEIHRENHEIPRL